MGDFVHLRFCRVVVGRGGQVGRKCRGGGGCGALPHVHKLEISRRRLWGRLRGAASYLLAFGAFGLRFKLARVVVFGGFFFPRGQLAALGLCVVAASVGVAAAVLGKLYRGCFVEHTADALGCGLGVQTAGGAPANTRVIHPKRHHGQRVGGGRFLRSDGGALFDLRPRFPVFHHVHGASAYALR